MDSRAKNLIGGEWIDTPKTFETRNPANTDEVVAELAAATPEMVGQAITAARGAFSEWSGLSVDERVRRIGAAGAKIKEEQDAIAQLITRDNGKKLPDATGEAMGSAFMCGNLRKIASGEDAYTVHHRIDKKGGAWAVVYGEPSGVGALLVPFNFPFWTPITKLVAALAAGNTIVMKSPMDAPASTHRLIEIFQETGLFPAGVLNLIHGPGLGSAFTQDHLESWDRVSFTGGTGTGLKIAAACAEKNIPVATEMGGLNELVLGPDVKPGDKLFEKFLRFAFEGMLCNGGQMCTAVSRIVVPEEHYEAVRDGLADRLRSAKMGSGLDEGVMVTPLTGKGRLEEIATLAKRATDKGEGELIVGGHPASDLEGFTRGKDWELSADPSKSFFMEPTLFGKVDPRSEVLGQTEIFGPVAHICTYEGSDFAQVLEMNATCPFGLHAGIVTGDAGIAKRYTQGTKAGTIFINKLSVFADPRVPFGGMKLSGNGEKELGPDALHFWQDQKSIEVNADFGLFPDLDG